MKKIKKYLYSFLIGIGSILVLSFILNTFYYFNIVSDKINDVFKIIIPIVSLFASGILLGRKSLKKGWLEGLKLSALFIVLIVLINVIFIKEFSIQTILYYVILALSTIFGSMIGINKK